MRGDTNFKGSDSNDPSVYFLFCGSAANHYYILYNNFFTEIELDIVQVYLQDTYSSVEVNIHALFINTEMKSYFSAHGSRILQPDSSTVYNILRPCLAIILILRCLF